MNAIFQQPCGCADCEAAVSPAAYLTALFDYALKHVRKNSKDKIDLPFLVDTFHQPFDVLPTDCEAVEKRVRQVRICVEVLRSYLGTRPLADAAKEAALAKAEEDYRFAVYTLLLGRIGTTYEEIRRIYKEPQESRKALAERLGIGLTEPRPADPPGDELDRLFLDAGAVAPAPHVLTEPVLETLFGLADTARDPLSEAAKLGDDQAQIIRWNLNGAAWEQNTDPEGRVHATLVNPAGAGFRVELYKDPARTILVAAGEIATASGTVKLVQENNSGLSGVAEIAYTADSASISIAAIPTFLSWQLNHLRTLWTRQDHPRDVYSDEASPKLPLIDPDLIGPDDFRTPFPKSKPTDPDKAFDLWLNRRALIDTTFDGLKTDRETKGLTEILEQVLGTPLPDIDGLLATLTKSGTPEKIKTAKDEAEALGLSIDGLTRLMSIRAKDQLAQGDARNEKVSDEEWREVYSILTQAVKVKKFDAWRIEEQADGVRLGLEEFWFSLREPTEGDWPPVFKKGQPLIDPDLVKLADLPEWLAGKEAVTPWNARKATIDQLPGKLKTERETNGFDAMLRLALGHPAPGNPLQHDLDTLKKGLGNTNDSVRDAATQKIETDLHLTVESFGRLMVIKAANDQTDPAKKPTSTEWVELYALLTPPRKLKHEYPAWVNEENTTGLVYWKALKAKLPRWRASIEARQTWRQALRVRTQRPIIDPTVMGADDLRHNIPGDPAFDIWKDRYDRRLNLLNALETTRKAAPTELNGLDAIIEDALGFEPAELEAIDLERQHGHSVEKRLGQLELINGAFTYLMRIRGLAQAGQPITDSEWETVYTTLAQAQIQREFAALRAEEEDEHILLSPDFFKIPKALLTSLPFLDPATPLWLSTWQARRDWQDTLQSRIDQENSLLEALRNAISAVEEASLPGLRDALIQASDAAGNNLDERAKWVTERLLIDAKAGGCQITTRVAQAIETIQTLIFDLRSGQFKHLGTIPLTLISDHFDEEWKWIGSYATWRAAMFVFLYPENILQPSLLQYQTPAFDGLIKRTRQLRLDPETACKEAQAYAEYFRDVCSLDIEATCLSYTRMYTGDSCDRQATSLQSIFYMFGRAASGKIYWSAYEASGRSPYGQTPWKEVPGFGDARVFRIVGAMPYRKRVIKWATPGEGFTALLSTQISAYIHLFCIVGKEDKQTLKMARLNLDAFGTWHETVIELPVPPISLSSSEIVPVQTQSEYSRPGLIFRTLGYYRLYYRQLNSDGIEWEQSNVDWSSYFFQFIYTGWISMANSPVQKIEAVLRVNSDMLWFATTWTDGDLDLQLIGLKSGNQPPSVSRAWTFGKSSAFLGAIPGPEDDIGFGLPVIAGPQVSAVYFFWRDSSGTHYRRFTNIFGDEANNPVHGALADLVRIAPHSGSGATGQQTLAYKRTKYAQAYYMYQYSEAGDKLVALTTLRVIPRVKAPLTIPRHLSAGQLQQRRQEIIDAFALNADATPAVLTYLREAYYFVPLHLALALQRTGQYLASLDWFRTVYDYEAQIGPPNQRNIYYGLELDAKLPAVSQYQQASDWLLDPLNPHSIAATRRYAYARFTIMSLVRCLLDFADLEFTQETGESLARARTLYLTALDLLSLPELQQKLGICEDLIGELRIHPGKDIPPEVPAAVGAIMEDLTNDPIWFFAVIPGLVKDVKSKLNENVGWDVKLAEARAIVQKAAANAPVPSSAGAMVTAEPSSLKKKQNLLLTLPTIDYGLQAMGKAAVGKLFDIGQPEPINPRNNGKAPQNIPPPPLEPAIAPSLQFCIPPNPMLKALRAQAEINLVKLRSCRNIAGLKREQKPYAAPTDITTGLPVIEAGGQLTLPGINQVQPTVYRYAILIERAKHFVQLAVQLEASMLTALEKRDQATYDLLKARQQLTLTQAGITLQSLRVTEAKSGIKLATLQQERAQLQSDVYQQWIEAGLNQFENQMIEDFKALAKAQAKMATASYLLGEAALYGNPISLGPLFGLIGNIVNLAQGKDDPILESAEAAQGAAYLNRNIQTASLRASFERHKQDWELQKSLAEQDYKIATQQIEIATENVRVVEQEKTIAQLQATNDKDTIEFLGNKFTSFDLYDWMSEVLEGVYRSFLQQATTMAKLALDQLAFERQEVVPPFIKTDYWVDTASQTGNTTEQDKSSDRKGLTGSARLLQDIYQLDQYAFDTNKRKLQITKVVSLAQQFPIEFQRFRETGVMTFPTPMEMFDRDFPGHYLRLIRRVRTSIIALIPPTQGVHATLTTSGLSRVVIGPDIFQTVPIRRDPEFVALTSPANSTGLFELEALQSEMLLPFEGNGVDTTWEFRMPKAANQIDYRTIADVLVTIDYTALNSFDYRQQVIQILKPNLSAERSFSFRNQFADQWYDLHNSDLTSTPMTVRFKTFHEDFPPNIDALKIQQVLLYFVRADGKSFEVPVAHLHYTAQGESGAVGGSATSIDGIISTRRGNAGSWTMMIGKSPAGEWELTLPNTEEMRNRFKNEEIEDILFVITYSGKTPAWPV